MASRHAPLTLIVAATTKHGIGKDGGLPWPMLKHEMAYFARVTKRVPGLTSSTASQITTPHNVSSRHRKNVVIMGRKTWDGIPPKFRPLKDRTNIVLTRGDTAKIHTEVNGNGSSQGTDNVLVAESIEAGLDTLDAGVEKGHVPPPGRIFVIGGAAIYDAALRLETAKNVLLTRVRNDFECDTFFPVALDNGDGEHSESDGAWKRQSQEALSQFVEESVEDNEQEETTKDGVKVGYRFMLYQRP